MVKLKKINDSIPIKVGTKLSCGYDLSANTILKAFQNTKESNEKNLKKIQESFIQNGFINIRPGERILFGTGYILKDINKDLEIQIRSRSGYSLKKGLFVANQPGTIDSDYRGEIGVIIYNSNQSLIKIKRHDYIAQMVFNKIERPQIIMVEEGLDLDIEKPTKQNFEDMTSHLLLEVYTNDIVRQNKDKIFVFGDNTERRGMGGQAIIRNNENAFGIATKKSPSMDDTSFMYDTDFQKNIEIIIEDIEKIKKDGRTVVFPKKGLGTGLAQLKEKAPLTFKRLNNLLYENFGYINPEKNDVYKNYLNYNNTDRNTSGYGSTDN